MQTLCHFRVDSLFLSKQSRNEYSSDACTEQTSSDSSGIGFSGVFSCIFAREGDSDRRGVGAPRLSRGLGLISRTMCVGLSAVSSRFSLTNRRKFVCEAESDKFSDEPSIPSSSSASLEYDELEPLGAGMRSGSLMEMSVSLVGDGVSRRMWGVGGASMICGP